MLESSLHKDNAFVTLTYNDEHLPAAGTLVPADTQKFLKRLRKALAPIKIRYYLVGEYGDETNRPHYHLAIFGFPSCAQGITKRRRDGSCCQSCDLLQALWSQGNVFVGNLEPASASYISGYVTKKLTNKDDERLEGRHPEFARMSLRPGIGADMMDEIASTLLENNLDDVLPDVPTVLLHGRDKWPLGRYLTRRLRARIGRDVKAPQATLQKMEEKLLPVRRFAEANAPKGHKSFTFKQALIDVAEGQIINAEARHRRNRKRGNQ